MIKAYYGEQRATASGRSRAGRKSDGNNISACGTNRGSVMLVADDKVYEIDPVEAARLAQALVEAVNFTRAFTPTPEPRPEEVQAQVMAEASARMRDALKSTIGETFTPEAKSQIVERIQDALSKMLSQPHFEAYGITAGELRAAGFELDADIPDFARTRGGPHITDARIDDEHVVHFRLEADFEAP